MTYRGEYTTVSAVRNLLGANLTTDDALLLDCIRDVSQQIDNITNRHWYPVIETRSYDMVQGSLRLVFDDDLLEATTVTNGDGTTIASTDYKLYPLNSTPKNELQLLTTRAQWNYPTSGEDWAALSVLGVWGFHQRYAAAWPSAGTTSASATASETIILASTTANPGDLLKIGVEYLYYSSASSGSLVVERGCNGSTSGSIAASASIYRWVVSQVIEMVARRAVTGLYRLRSNPLADTVTIDGVVFSTPKDVTAYLRTQLEQYAGFTRIGFV
jgi:hypothetical protein